MTIHRFERKDTAEKAAKKLRARGLDVSIPIRFPNRGPGFHYSVYSYRQK